MNRRSQLYHPAAPLQTPTPCWIKYSTQPLTSRSPGAVAFARRSLGAAGRVRKPRGSGRSNDTREAPMYRFGPPQSLYAHQVVVERASTIAVSRPGLGERTTKNA